MVREALLGYLLSLLELRNRNQHLIVICTEITELLLRIPESAAVIFHHLSIDQQGFCHSSTSPSKEGSDTYASSWRRRRYGQECEEEEKNQKGGERVFSDITGGNTVSFLRCCFSALPIICKTAIHHSCLFYNRTRFPSIYYNQVLFFYLIYIPILEP